MNPSTVFSPRRLMGTARIAAMTRSFRCLLAATAVTLPAFQTSRAQAPGTLDNGDNGEPGFKPAQVTATVYATLYETNGIDNSIVLAGGDNGFLQTSLQPNGKPKGTFVPPIYGSSGRIVFTAVPELVGTTTTVNNVTKRAIPKVLLGGLFGQSAFQILGKTPAQNIVRILPDGTQDTTFAVGAGANNFVTSILPLPDGKTVVGGLFTSFAGQPRLRIVRLNTNGSVDGNFSASSIIDNDVLALASGISPSKDSNGNPVLDGKTIVAGTFNHVGGVPVTKLARLDVNGNLDPTFRPVIDTRVNAITVQPTGKIIIGGEFTSINGRPAPRIARLNYDGSLDTTFAAAVTGLPMGETTPVAVFVLNQLKDPNRFSIDPATPPNPNYAGKIYVGGNFTQINGATRRYLGVINPDGTVGAFDPGVRIYDKVQSIFVQPNGRVLVGETLGPKIGKVYQPTLIRLFGATNYD